MALSVCPRKLSKSFLLFRPQPNHLDSLKHDQAHSQHSPKSWVFPVPKDTLQRIFGTSQVFQGFEEPQPKPKGLTVPLKVREYYFQGQRSLEKEDWEMAVLFFSRALHLEPHLVDFYALRAEAYIQLCDFSSAAQNLRRAYSFKPESTKYLERLTLVLYLQMMELIYSALPSMGALGYMEPLNP